MSPVNEGLTWQRFYKDVAHEIFPVIEIGPGRPVDLVVSRGLLIPARTAFPAQEAWLSHLE